jgi:hypothetical protein
MINNLIHPAHIPAEHFIPMLSTIVEQRIANKEMAKDKTLEENVLKTAKSFANILKIVVNVVYGKLNDVYHWLLDANASYTVTVNCQLALLMLVEKLNINNFEIVSVNTDGVLTKVPKIREDEYYKICNEWAEYFNYGVEYATYLKYIATSVNDYLAVKDDGSIKEKGVFVEDKTLLHDYLIKGYSMPIVSIALKKYLLYNIPIRETIHNHINTSDDAILDYAIAQKIGKDYIPYIESLNESKTDIELTPIQSTIRYYISNKGVALVKINDTGKKISLIAKEYCTLINNLSVGATHDIKFAFYINECDKILNSIHNKITSKNKKQNGRLFDNL